MITYRYARIRRSALCAVFYIYPPISRIPHTDFINDLLRIVCCPGQGLVSAVFDLWVISFRGGGKLLVLLEIRCFSFWFIMVGWSFCAPTYAMSWWCGVVVVVLFLLLCSLRSRVFSLPSLASPHTARPYPCLCPSLVSSIPLAPSSLLFVFYGFLCVWPFFFATAYAEFLPHPIVKFPPPPLGTHQQKGDKKNKEKEKRKQRKETKKKGRNERKQKA